MAVRVKGILSEEFTVPFGVHQVSVLSPLLFVIVLEALSGDFRAGLPWELPHADYLVLIADSVQDAEAKFRRRREGIVDGERV